MKTFHCPGRIGDIVFQLYTVKALGGGKLYVSDYHHPNWNLDIARSMESFLRYQEYVTDVEFVHYKDLPKLRIDYDLQHAEDDYNPVDFPEWTGSSWPGNCNIRKRYAVHFGVPFERDVTWLTAPCIPDAPSVAMHIPMYRMVRPVMDWGWIQIYLEAALSALNTTKFVWLLDTAKYINSAKVFLGTVSCGNAIAEGLGKRRIVEHKEDCFNVVPDIIANGMSNEQVVEAVMKLI